MSKTGVSVTIADTECVISTIISTQITCRTGTFTKSSVKAAVQLFIDGKGKALNVILTKISWKILIK